MERRMLRAAPVTSARRLRRARGFTLIELAIVVTIVLILAVIGMVGYRRYMLHSKITEAQGVVSAIRIAQEDYRAEKGTYANIGTNYCPAGAGVGNQKVGWNSACSGGTLTWATLPVHVDGAVLFSYATVADTVTFTSPPADAAWVTFNAPTAVPWYVVMAKCDLDSAGGAVTQLVGTSFENRIFSRNEGQ